MFLVDCLDDLPGIALAGLPFLGSRSLDGQIRCGDSLGRGSRSINPGLPGFEGFVHPLLHLLDGSERLRLFEPFRGGTDDRPNGQLELLGKFKVALVMRRHRHDSAGTVADENIVGDPNWDLLLADRVDGKGAGEDAGFLLG